MGNAASASRRSAAAEAALANARSYENKAPRRALSLKFETIVDKYSSLGQVTEALRAQGLESSQLVIGVDFTKSNEWTGNVSFGGRCLHSGAGSPYEEAISIIGRTLEAFDDDRLLPCYGFGDASTHDKDVFSFRPNDEPCAGFQDALQRYRAIVPNVRLAGPTSFAPLIHKAMDHVEASGYAYHILLIIADGQVTRGAELPVGYLSPQEKETMDAIVGASHLPLSIVMVGVGDGPWDVMQAFDDALPSRKFDNFQFVNYTELRLSYNRDVGMREAAFALRALMEIPDQYRLITTHGIVNNPPANSSRRRPFKRALDPPAPRALRKTTSTLNSQHSQELLSSHNSILNSQNGIVNPHNRNNPRYVCPITQEVMQDPVFASDGYTYERTAITQWLASHDTSPMSNLPLDHKHLTPNHPLRSEILEAFEGGDQV